MRLLQPHLGVYTNQLKFEKKIKLSTVVTDQNADIREFAKAPLVDAMFKLLNPTAKLIIPMIVPHGGDIMNALGMTVFHAEAQTFFQQFCESLIQQRQNDKSGRQRDFLNIMCKFF